MYETYTDVPTIFEIKIRELGWIYDVYLEVDDTHIPAEWVGFSNFYDSHSGETVRFSIFNVLYTFENVEYNKRATFHYSINGCNYVCEPFIFNVEPFYDA